jgi:hypothetical protein
MSMPKKKNVLGAWAFLIGVILALVVGLLGITAAWVMPTLVILGIIIGLLNIGGAELKDFLLAGAVLVIVSTLAADLLNISISVVDLGAVLNALVALFVPATVVVALKVVFAMAKR